MDDLLLGLDLGTTRCKAVLIDAAGAELASATAWTPFHEAGGGTEMPVAELLATVSALCRSLPAGAGRIAGAGIAAMAECGAALDRAGNPLAPIIAWHDLRGSDVADRVLVTFGPSLALRTGQRPRPVSTIAKLGWVVAHGYGPVAGWLGVAELCLRDLTGVAATEHSFASRTGCYDVVKGIWLEGVAKSAGFRTAVFAPVLAAGSVMGSVRPEAAERWGLPAGIPVTLAGHDHLAGMVGAGARVGAGVRAGDLVNSVGTAETVVGSSPVLPDIARAVDLRVAISLAPGGTTWSAMTGATRAGLVLEAAAVLLQRTLAELDALAEAAPEAADVGPLLDQLVALAAGRPADPRSALVDAPPGAVWLGLLDGLALRTAEAAGRVGAVVEGRRMLVIGGGAASRPWLRAKAAAVPLPLLVARTGFAAARGAAIQAGVAAGWWATTAEAPAPELDPVEGRPKPAGSA